MSPNNLSRDEARERARLLAVAHYDVDLDLSADGPTFPSKTTVRFGCVEPGAATFIELLAPSLAKVTLNGRELDPAEVFHDGRVELAGLAADNELTIVANAAYSRTGEGLHRFIDPVDGETYLYSQFEAYDAHRMYACFDQPDLKARLRLQVTGRPGWTCVSNAPVAARPGPLRWEFAATQPMSTYITALVAGPYHEVRDRHEEIDLGLFCRRSLAPFLDADELFTVTKQGFDFFHRAFDYRYPFGKYDQLFVPEFNAGAMENAGCVTFLEDYVFRSKVTDSKRERRAETILHEMAHMWFGDLVTMRWWDDLWLNESFASYLAVLALTTNTRFTQGWTTFCNAEKTWAYQQDQLPSTHPIAADAPDIDTARTNFDGITYAKGASVLKQLVSWVGQEEFLAGLRSYFRRHEFANTSLADLLSVLEEASGRDLASWSKEWLGAAGVNTLRARFTTDEGAFTSFQVEQEAPLDHPTLRSHRLAIGLYDRGPAGLVRRDRVELDVVGALTDVAKLAGIRVPDLLLLNDDDLTYAKIRLDPTSLRTVVDHLGEVREPLPRALCWAAAWDMTRDAEMAARDWLSLVLGVLDRETDIGVLQSLLAKAETAIAVYGDPGNLSAARARLAEATARLAGAAEPGSDFQLAFVTAFARVATTPDQLAFLRGLLDGTTSMAGLEVDTDLRWHLLTELASRGEAGEADIEGELRRDATAAGEKRAASARTAMPVAAAKAAAWAAVVESDALSNHLQAATLATFWLPEQAELCRPYAERFFAEVGRLWRDRTPEIAGMITERLYPGVLIEQATLDRTDRYLAAESPGPMLARLLVEARDRVARALRARQCDAAAAARAAS